MRARASERASCVFVLIQGLYLAEGQLLLAENALRRALALDAALADAHNNLGNVLRSLGARAPRTDRVMWYRKGSGRLAEASASYARALALEPDHCHAHNNMGNIHKAHGDFAAAADCYRAALAAQPVFAAAMSNLGSILRERGDLQAAERAYHSALEMNPDFADAYRNLSGMCRLNGDLGGARRHLERALVLTPNCAETLCHMGARVFFFSRRPDVLAPRDTDRGAMQGRGQSGSSGRHVPSGP